MEDFARRYVEWIIIVVLIALAGAVYGVISGFEARGRARLLQEQLDVATANWGRAEQARAIVVREKDEEIAKLRYQRDTTTARADSIAATRPALVTRIIEIAGDSSAVVEAVQELNESHEAETTALRVSLSLANQMFIEQGYQLEATNIAYTAALERADKADLTIQAWEQARAPNNYDKIIAAVAIGFVIGVVAF